jgi:predicted nuclease of predicted toxin-antitoxin system
MANLYADEQFPLKATQHLRTLGHDVLTVQEAGNANRRISDDAVLAFATSQNRAVLTLNRRDFIRLHKQSTDHAGIIVCKDDSDKQQLAERCDRAIQAESLLAGKLVRVQKGS